MKYKPSAFTLIELLLTIGIIAILAAIVIVAINPTRQLRQAEDAKVTSGQRQLKSALDQYYIGNGEYPATLPSTIDNATDICSLGGSGSACLEFGKLVPDYISDIPRSTTEADTQLTGYRAYQENNVSYVYSVYKGKTLESLAASDMIAHWKFDESSTGAALDSSGNGYHATPVPATGIDPSARVPNLKFVSYNTKNFDNTDDYLTAGPGIAPSSAISICSWIYSRSWDEADEEDIIVRSNVTNTTGNFVFEFGNNTCDGGAHRALRFGVGNQQASTLYACSGSDIELSTWYHVCATYDGTDAIIYLDGTEVASTPEPGGITADSETLYIGGRPGEADYFDGYLDDLRIYDRALSTTEVSELASGL